MNLEQAIIFLEQQNASNIILTETQIKNLVLNLENGFGNSATGRVLYSGTISIKGYAEDPEFIAQEIAQKSNGELKAINGTDAASLVKNSEFKTALRTCLKSF